MYEIIANPEQYQIDHLINGTGNANVEISKEERDNWAGEIVNFSEKLTEFAKKSKALAKLLSSTEKISATPYHPEAGPGPNDGNYLFDQFLSKL